MADEADEAEERQSLFIEEALKRTLKNRRFDKESLPHCIECDESIPEARQKLGGVTRCIECQTQAEKGQYF